MKQKLNCVLWTRHIPTEDNEKEEETENDEDVWESLDKRALVGNTENSEPSSGGADEASSLGSESDTVDNSRRQKKKYSSKT